MTRRRIHDATPRRRPGRLAAITTTELYATVLALIGIAVAIATK